MMQRLIKTYETTAPDTLDDGLNCIMATIEDGLLKSGFVPGEDYTKRDLMNAALPMLMKAWNDDRLLVTTGWPLV